MPQLSIDSRFQDIEPLASHDGYNLTDDYVPLRLVLRDDTVAHRAGEGDTWASIAQRYYQEISERAAGLWWIICDFQPQPVVDPTLAITPGRIVYVPSAAMVRTEVLPFRREVYQ
jgi:hypothetical protein